MIAEIKPSSLSGKVTPPPSKSYSQRYLIAAALSQGVSKITNLSPCNDVKAMTACLQALGASVLLFRDEKDLLCATVYGPMLGGENGTVMPCGESGATLRFLMPLCMRGRETLFTGEGHLFERPLTAYEQICAEEGIELERTKKGIVMRGELVPGVFKIPGNVSSQFFSGLLFALPLLSEKSVICPTTDIESRPYIDMTLSVIRDFGIMVYEDEDDNLIIPGNQTYQPLDRVVEPDCSAAAIFAALAHLGNHITVDCPSPDETLQGDAVFPSYFEALECGTPTLDLSDSPDLAPILFALAACKHGAHFRGVNRLQYKESNRGDVMMREMTKFGVAVVKEGDGYFVPGGALHAPTSDLNGDGDHRIIMALSMLCTRTGGRILGAESVSKSMPDFFHCLRALGANISFS